MFTCTLLGDELFANYCKFDANGAVDLVNGSSPRPNFDDLQQGFIAIFLFIIGDNWNNYMYGFMIAVGHSYCIFFIMV